MEKNISFLKGIFGTMQNPDVNNSYMSDKRAIVNLFNNTKERTVDDIRLRLTVIDSMYSTQMNRRYYALDELAEKLSSFSKDDFVSFASQRPVKDSFKGLWSGRYGIGKDGKEKGIAVSLISKYAYFETGFQFPIYDSIACEMLPLVNSFCGFDDNGEKPLFTDNGKLIVNFMKEHQDTPAWKARDIAEGLFISSRAVSGAMRKLVNDGFIEKVGQDPTIYSLTENGKNIIVE